MNKFFKYLSYIIRHKYYVLVAGLKVRAPLFRLIIHDWSKFLPYEFAPYMNYFYGKYVDYNSDTMRVYKNLFCQEYPKEYTKE